MPYANNMPYMQVKNLWLTINFHFPFADNTEKGSIQLRLSKLNTCPTFSNVHLFLQAPCSVVFDVTHKLGVHAHMHTCSHSHTHAYSGFRHSSPGWLCTFAQSHEYNIGKVYLHELYYTLCGISCLACCSFTRLQLSWWLSFSLNKSSMNYTIM